MICCLFMYQLLSKRFYLKLTQSSDEINTSKVNTKLANMYIYYGRNRSRNSCHHRLAGTSFIIVGLRVGLRIKKTFYMPY